MNKSHIQLLFSYNYWAHDQIMETAVQLTPEQLADLSLPNDQSILSTLTHTLNAESLWRHRLQHRDSPPKLKFEQPATSLSVLKNAWAEEKALMERYIDSLTDDALLQTLPYGGLSGRQFESVVWHILLQLINHGVAHRSEVALKLTELGHSPGNLDFIIYIRE